jgi:hypothetical protein
MSALTLSGINLRVDAGWHLSRYAASARFARTSSKPPHQDAVRLGAGLIATIAALVLGLLITAAKGSFDTQTGQVRQITADLILLDNILGQYGPEARAIREQIRSTVDPFADGLWREKGATATGPLETNAAAERVYLEIHKLSPHDDLQHSLKTRAVQISNDLAQGRFLLFVEAENLIAKPFLAVLAFWLMIIFASFSLFSPMNGTIFTCPFPFSVCPLGGVCNFSDHGTEPTIHRTNDDIQRTTAKRAWNNMRSHHECSIQAEFQNSRTASPVRMRRSGLAGWRCARGLPGRRLRGPC